MVTPANRGEPRGNNGQEGSDSEDSTPSKTPPETTSYRWVSNASGISFSVPSSFLPSASLEGEMDVDNSTLPETDQPKPSENYNVNPHPARPPTKCSFDGCELMRKYRLVKNFEAGACGMEHLKLLQARTEVS
jgi:Ino eighty subunit 2